LYTLSTQIETKFKKEEDPEEDPEINQMTDFQMRKFKHKMLDVTGDILE